MLGYVVDSGRELVETALVGRVLSPTALGHYRYGRKLATLPGAAVIEVFSYVLFPAFSRIAEDAVRFRTAFLRALAMIWCAACPLAGLLVASGSRCGRAARGAVARRRGARWWRWPASARAWP